jgi:hypothetical protein
MSDRDVCAEQTTHPVLLKGPSGLNFAQPKPNDLANDTVAQATTPKDKTLEVLERLKSLEKMVTMLCVDKGVEIAGAVNGGGGVKNKRRRGSWEESRLQQRGSRLQQRGSVRRASIKINVVTALKHAQIHRVAEDVAEETKPIDDAGNEPAIGEVKICESLNAPNQKQPLSAPAEFPDSSCYPYKSPATSPFKSHNEKAPTTEALILPRKDGKDLTQDPDDDSAVTNPEERKGGGFGASKMKIKLCAPDGRIHPSSGSAVDKKSAAMFFKRFQERGRTRDGGNTASTNSRRLLETAKDFENSPESPSREENHNLNFKGISRNRRNSLVLMNAMNHQDHQSKREWFIISHNSVFSRRFSMMIVCLVIWESLEVPWVVSFHSKAGLDGGWKIYSFLIDMLFILDLFLNFVTTFVDTKGQQVNKCWGKNGIAQNYFWSGWFAIDFVVVLLFFT